MRLQRLALFSFLLAAHVLLAEGKKEKDRKKAHSPGHRGQSRMRPAGGRFQTPDQAACTWAAAEQGAGATLKVACTRQEKQFSCFFAGNPHSCPEFASKKRVYWRQIGRDLVRQTNICEDSKTVLKTKLCRKKFPEAHLKMVNSTLIKNKHSPGKSGQSPVVTEAKKLTTTTPPKPTLVKATAPAGARQQNTGISGPECEQDPDLQYQRKLAEDYCGESWGTFCKFFLAMFQDKPC
ncbi:fibroblast growth factor-binding protein 1 [Orycteropus afer afer]|uniref:Fibroblast growth factor-binding protein 1 n=1 Tax=Orycteropus afer afer TaxID=1230840 RepID=A0A8B7AJV7_ORYAF|nr:fibroblast growth factor-binding protein 1 [Orycteropus afer afer]